MLAVCTKDSLVVLGAAVLKKLPTSTSPPLVSSSLSQPPIASAWSSDNSCLFVASSNGVSRHDASGSFESLLVSEPRPVTALLSKDRGATLLYSCRNEVAVLDVASRQVTCKLDSHDEDVSLLSLSNDASLLASSSVAGDVHVHNLSEASHTVIRAVNTASREGQDTGHVSALTFHPHSRAKLLLGVGFQLQVYDTSKPTAPTKTVPLGKTAGPIVAIACSPFSKSLVAVACGSGNISLVDLDKEKGLFRTLSLHATVTSMVFSAEGAALYVGTEDGKILILDLRALDKPAKPITISSDGSQIVCLSVQRKLRPGEGPVKSPIRRRVVSSTIVDKKSSPMSPVASGLAAEKLKPHGSGTVPRTRTISAHASPVKPKRQPTPVDNSKSTPPTPSRLRRVSAGAPPPVPPARSRTISGVSAVSSPSSRITSSSRASKTFSSATSVTSISPSVPKKRTENSAPRKSFSPPKSPLRKDTVEESEPEAGDSACVETLFDFPKPSEPMQEEQEETTKPNSVTTRQKATRTRTISESTTSPRLRAPSSRAVHGKTPVLKALIDNNVERKTLLTSKAKEDRESTRARTLSSRLTKTAPPLGPTSRATVVISPAPTLSPVPPVPPLPTQFQNEEQLTAIDIKWSMSRTPSPDFASLPSVPGMSVNGRVQGGRPGAGAGRKRQEKETTKPNGRANSLGVDVLGLGMPEVRRWVRSGHVGTDDDDDDDDDDGGPSGSGEDDQRKKLERELAGEPEQEVLIENIEVLHGENGCCKESGATGGVDEPTIKMTVQISPRRPSGSETNNHQWPSAGSPYNVLKNPQLPNGASASTAYQPNTNPAHDLLHTLIRDALYDFRRETKTEIIGLHLDLVKMGRGWRKEMRESLDKWGEELHKLKEENESLRGENERLRRGY